MAERRYLRAALGAAGCGAALLAAILFSGRMDAGVSGGGAERLETALREAAATCYAVEGRYPDGTDYLERRYGIRISDHYDVHYSIFASNIPPEIAVREKRGTGA